MYNPFIYDKQLLKKSGNVEKYFICKLRIMHTHKFWYTHQCGKMKIGTANSSNSLTCLKDFRKHGRNYFSRFHKLIGVSEHFDIVKLGTLILLHYEWHKNQRTRLVQERHTHEGDFKCLLASIIYKLA